MERVYDYKNPLRVGYRGCDIEVFIVQTLGGWVQVDYSVFTHPMTDEDRAYEIDSGYFYCDVTLFEAVRDCKQTVDAFQEAGGIEGWE